MFASKSERKVHYSIRKFSIGVASVVVASLFLGGVVHAEEVGGRNTPTVTSSGQDLSKKYADEVESHLKKILSEIQTQLDRKRHTKTVALINELQDIKKTYLYNLNVLKEKSKAELPSKIKAKLDVAFEQFKKDTLKPGEKVAEAEKKVEEAKKKAKAQKEEDFRNYPTNTYKTLELEIAESDVKVKEAELELVNEEVKEPLNEGTIKQAKEKVESEKAEAIRLEEIKTDRKKAEATRLEKIKTDRKKAEEEAKRQADAKEQEKPKRRAKRGVPGVLATPDKKENDAKSSDSSVGEETLPSPSLNMANKSQTEHRKAAKQVDEYIEKMLSEIQLDKRKHTQNFALNIKLSRIKTEYLYGLKEKSEAELPSKIKEKLDAAFEQFKKEPELTKKVAEAKQKAEEAEKKAKAQKEEDFRNYPTNTYKTLELEIAESDVKVKEAELELVKEEAKEHRNEEKIKQVKAKVESKKAEATRLEKIKTDRKKAAEAKRKAAEAEKKVAEAKPKVDAEEYALEAKIAELEYEVQRLEKELKEIDESDSEDYVKEGLCAPLQSKLDTKKAKLSKLEELSDKIDELDAEIAKLEDQLKDAEKNNNVEDYVKEGLEKTIAEKKAELEKTEADLKKVANEPETPAPAPAPEKPETPAEKPALAPAPKPEKPTEQPKAEKPDDQQAEEDYARRSEEEYNRLTQQQPPKAEKPAPAPAPEKPAEKPAPAPEKPAPAPEKPAEKPAPAPAPEKPAEKPAPAPAPEKPAPAPEKPAPTPETPKTGWKQENGMWYFYNTDGSMATGWLQNNGSWYYLNSNGAMATGWLQNNGSWYYLNSNGAMATGW
ncbi:TPA: RICH domain-containing protein, partial [Streptococcus pneumoniae]|nr:RICH domain-containing protein [Streptococcus pneumoniae]